jgi:group I intron endonuclease
MERSVSPSLLRRCPVTGKSYIEQEFVYWQPLRTELLADLDKPPDKGTGIVYAVRSPSGKMYIGQTRQSLAARWQGHCKVGPANKCMAIVRAIAKYGKDRMQVWVMERVPLAKLGAREKALIAEHNTMTPNGYNITRGGDESPMCTPAVAARSRATNALPEVRAKRAKVYASAPTKKRMHEARKANWADAEYREMMSKAKRGSAKCVEHYARMRASKTEESHAKQSAAWEAKREAKLAMYPPEVAARMRAEMERKREHYYGVGKEKRRTQASAHGEGAGPSAVGTSGGYETGSEA